VPLGALGLCNIGAVVEIDTYYDLLGVSVAADAREIRAAFRRVAKRLHPDLVGNQHVAHDFKRIYRAYKVLRDPEMRAAYDAHLEQLRAIVVARDPFRAESDGISSGTAAFARRRQLWREAQRMSASFVVLSICLVAFAVAWGRMANSPVSHDGATLLPVGDIGGQSERADSLRDSVPRPPERFAVGSSVALESSPQDAETRAARMAVLEGLRSSAVAQPRSLSPGAREADTKASPQTAPPLTPPDFTAHEVAEAGQARQRPNRDGAQPSRPVPDELAQAHAMATPDPVPTRDRNDTVPARRQADDLAQATRLMGQGERYLAQGNIAIARGYFERAADLGLPIAAMKLAETHDPGALAAQGWLGPKGDPAEARKWYERAMALGLHAEAQIRRLYNR